MEEINWVEKWEEAQRQSPGNAHTRSEALWTSFWDIIARRYLVDSVSDEKTHRSIVTFLGMESYFMKGDTVLDIGCGPGTYTLLFAENASSVDALDTSPRMIEVLMEEAAERGLHNIREIPAGWEDYEPEKRYGLVFSGMSPAVHDEGTLLKMERYASRSCCVVTYGDAHGHPFIKDLWGSLIGEYHPSNAYHYTYPYNILQQGGRNPALRMFNLDHHRRTSVDEMVSHYTTYFNIFTEIDEKKTAVIRRYFDERSPGGFFERETQLKLAAICWKVPVDG